MTHSTTVSQSGHPDSCPWCGQRRIHGICSSPGEDRHYRCVACGTTFFVHQLPQRLVERAPAPHCPPPVKPLRRFISRFAHKR